MDRFPPLARRLWLVLLALALLAACAAPAQGPATGSRIRFQFFGDAEERAIYEQIAQAYMAAHPGRAVELVNVPAAGDHMARLSASFAAGDPPEVFLVNYRRYAHFASSGVLTAVAPLMARDGIAEDDYYAVALEAFRYDGQLQCLPQNLSSLVVYYNRDLFEEHGVPLPQAGWSWGEFLRAARLLTLDHSGDGIPDVYGLGVEPELIRLAPFIWQSGGELVDDPSRPADFTLDSPAARVGLDFFLSLRGIYGVTPTEAEARAADPETRFRNGELAMVLNSRRVVPNFRTISGFSWDVAPLPAGEQAATVLHSDAYCIAGTAADVEAAWAFVRFAAGPEGQRRAAELGRIVPSLKAVAESPAFLDPARAPASSRVFLDVIPTMRVLPIVPAWPEIEKAVNEELEIAFYANDEAGELAGGEEESGARPLVSAAAAVIEEALRRADRAADEALRRTYVP